MKTLTLRSWCRDGAHREDIGRFQQDDEPIRLPNGQKSTGESWRTISRQFQGGFFFPSLVWRCETCGKDTLHDPKGVTWVPS